MLNILIAKAARSVEFDFDALPEVSKAYIISYGIRQTLNDATASLKETDFKSEIEFQDAAFALAEKKLAGIVSGELRSAVRVDPVTSEYMKQAVALVANKLLAANPGKKLKDYKMADLRARAEAIAENNPALHEKLLAKAQAVVSARAETIDTSDFEV